MRPFIVHGAFRVVACFLLLAHATGASGEDDPLAPGPERSYPELGFAFRVPGGIDPGPPSHTGEFGGRNLAFYFGLSDESKVEVRIEHYPTFDHLPAFVRRLKRKESDAGRTLGVEGALDLAGFDEAVRLEWKPDAGGRRAIQIAARRFRTIQLFGFTLPAGGEEALATAVKTVITSLRSTAEKPSGLPISEGWRVHATEHYEITTDADPALAGAVGDLLEAGFKVLRGVFPEARMPWHSAVVRLYGKVEDLVRFRESHRLSEEEWAFLFEDERVLVTGPLPKGKQTRRFGRWQVDMHQILWRQFEQFLLHAAGVRPDPWFAEGGGLWLGLGFTPELRFEAKNGADELARGIEESLTSRKAISLLELLEKTSLTEEERTVAASWFHFFLKGPGQRKKERLVKYLASYAASWDGKKANEAALGGDKVRRLTKTHARYFLYLADRARRRHR
ncbi:MAG: hypothetical protein ACYS47_11410 [Planctomycetota bacterium]|jgi:hypothetical protein